MPEYLAPGVYVEEIDKGVVPIEGVSTSTAGFVGMTARGPTTGRPQLVVSFRDFERKFGGYFNAPSGFEGHNMLPFAVDGFFGNGGQRVYIKRVASTGPNGATAATRVAQGGMVTRLTEDTDPSTATSKRRVKVATLRGIEPRTTSPPATGTDKSSISLLMEKDGLTKTSGPHTVVEIDRSSGELTLGSDVTEVFERRFTTVFTNARRLTTTGLLDFLSTPTATRDNTFTISAKDVGSWGSDLVVEVSPDPNPAGQSELSQVVASTTNETTIRLTSTRGFYVGAWVEIDRGRQKMYRPVTAVAGDNIKVGLQALAQADVASQITNKPTVVTTCELRVTVAFGEASEDFRGLTLANVPGRYYAARINAASKLITVSELVTPVPPLVPPNTATHPLAFPAGDDGIRVRLGPGSEGSGPPTPTDYRGTDGGPGKRTGIRALEDVDQISIIAAPGLTNVVVQQALIGQCEELKDRFAILDPAPGTANAPPTLDEIQQQRQRHDTRYAAIYYPRVMIDDPLTADPAPIPVPPSGHMAGIYARTDQDPGVHKAPANEVIRAIEELEVLVTKREQDILNPHPVNINVLRDFRADGRGLRVYGARVITSDTAWKYVPVRRLFIFLEESLDEGTQFVVFEPNDEQLWARVIQTVSVFLTRVWRDGALMGTTPEEAFFVRCDRTTMSEDDILNGRLIMEIGVAPVRPAEFVIIRISQKTLGAEV
jgi:uncharacterized protein